MAASISTASATSPGVPGSKKRRGRCLKKKRRPPKRNPKLAAKARKSPVQNPTRPRLWRKKRRGRNPKKRNLKKNQNHHKRRLFREVGDEKLPTPSAHGFSRGRFVHSLGVDLGSVAAAIRLRAHPRENLDPRRSAHR